MLKVLPQRLALLLILFIGTAQLYSQRLDCSFGANGVIQQALTNLTLPQVHAFDVYQTGPQAGKIVVAISEQISPQNGLNPENRNALVARLNANGTLDASFGTGGFSGSINFDGQQDVPKDIFALGDGKVVIVGQSDGPILAGGPQQGVFAARFNSNGSVDNSFDGDGKFKELRSFNGPNGQTSQIWKSGAIQPDGKILVCGRTNGPGSDSYPTVVRINANGGMDGTFGNNGHARVNFVREGVRTNNEEYFEHIAFDGTDIIAAGTRVRFRVNFPNDYHFIFARFTDLGVADTSFSSDGKETFQVVAEESHSITGVHAVGNKMLATFDLGNFPDFFNALQIDASGALDNTFGTGGYARINVSAPSDDRTGTSVLANNGKLYVLGNPGGGDDVGAIRLTPTGKQDVGFGTNGETNVDRPSLGSPSDAVIEPTGKLLVLSGSNSINLTRFETVPGTPDCTTSAIPSYAACKDITVELTGVNVIITATDIDDNSFLSPGPITGRAINRNTFGCAEIGQLNPVVLAVIGGPQQLRCTANVTVIDKTSPDAVCKTGTVYIDANGIAEVSVADIDGGSSDNCQLGSLSVSPDSLTCGNTGTNSVTLTVSDVSGNVVSCTTTVTVIDTIKPNAVCQNVTTYLDGSGNASILVADLDGGSSDNCSLAGTFSASQTAFVCTEVGANNVLLTVPDSKGNSDTCTAVVTVLDTIATNAVCQNITVFLDGTGNTSITAADVDGGSNDNCGLGTLSVSPSAFTCADKGTNTVTLTVPDINGSTSTCTAVVTVSDTISPGITCPANIQADNDPGTCEATVAYSVTTSDNCPGETLAQTVGDPSGSQFPFGTTTQTFVATDASGNTSTCSFTITVSDTSQPTFTVPGPVTILADSQCNFDASLSITGDVTDEMDNCASGLQATFNDVVTPIINSTDQLVTRTWTLDDGNGNVTTKVQLITVDDASPVEFSLLGDNPLSIARNATTPIPGFIAKDNCLGNLAGNVTVDSSQLDRNIPATYTVSYSIAYFDPNLQQTVSTTLDRTVIITGTATTLPLQANLCAGQSFNIASVVVDYSLQARRFDFYTVDPTTPGATRFATSQAFRGRARTNVMVSPSTTTSYWFRTVYQSGAFVDGEILITVSTCGGAMNASIVLEGAFDVTTATMRTSLQQANLIPLTEPYTGLGYTFVHGGGEQTTAAVLQQHAIVDWVVVELRDVADPSIITYSRTALLRSDGRVVDMNGTSVVMLQHAFPGLHYVSVKHRNHLALMSDLPLRILPGSLTQVDFSDPTVTTYGSGINRLLINGKALMYAGDADGNGQIQNTDDIMEWSPRVGNSGYEASDYNMDGQVQNTDRLLIWKHNVGRGSAVPD